MRKNLTLSVFMAIIILLNLPAFSDDKKDIQKKQTSILKMKDETLANLYKRKPEAKSKIKKAAGYAVFDNAGIHLLLLATSRGHGVAVDNATKKRVFMKMKTIGAGPGIGVKDYQVVFVFPKKDTLRKFVDSGWSFTGEADAAAKTKNEGGSMGGVDTSVEGMEIYTITKKGIALQATLGGTRFSRDDDLN